MNRMSVFSRYLFKAKRLFLTGGFILLAGANNSAFGQTQSIELESTFKGNQEQPKVLYIVPWQKIDAPDAYYQPLESLINESFELIDRDEFRREIRFRKQLAETQELK